MRKSILATFILGVVLTLGATSCRDKDAEKKIAQLESRISELEGKKPTSPSPVSPATVTPEEKPEGPLPVIAFQETEYDFGTVTEGQKVEHIYTFKNTGEAPLIIQDARPSCGCTVPDWTKEPIPVGGTGIIKAQFDTHGKKDAQNKTITVTANTWPKTTMLRFKAMVLANSGAPAEGPVKK